MEKEEKKCRECGKTKSLEEYYKHKRGKYGRRARCKLCVKAYNKAYRESEAGKAVQKAYNQSEAGKASHKKYQKKRRHNDPVFKLQGNLRSGY